jgi:hypothetical protein
MALCVDADMAGSLSIGTGFGALRFSKLAPARCRGQLGSWKVKIRWIYDMPTMDKE